MNYEQAMEALEKGKKVRLPEWQGYWFLGDTNEDVVFVLTKDGDVLTTPWTGPVVESRTDWELAEGLDFGWAINALKNGKLVSRKGWNGKGMFIFMRPADELPVEMIIDRVKSVPDSLKQYYLKSNVQTRGTTTIQKVGVTFTAYLCMKAADGTIVNGWLASQSDMLAEDWELFQN